MPTIAQVESAVVPRSMVIDPPFSDEELERFCSLNGALRIERTSEGVIRMNPPTGALTGDGNSEINFQLRSWWDRHERGRIFDSSTGFFLPDGSVLSPDAAYGLPEQLAGLTKADLAPHAPPLPSLRPRTSIPHRQPPSHRKEDGTMDRQRGTTRLADRPLPAQSHNLPIRPPHYSRD